MRSPSTPPPVDDSRETVSGKGLRKRHADEPLIRVFCDSCGKEITDIEDLVVLTTWFIGGLWVSCVPCFGSRAKRGGYLSENHVILNSLGVLAILVLSMFYGGIIALLIWFIYLASRQGESPPGLGLVLGLFALALIISYIKLMVQRWISRVEFERPLLRRAQKT